MKRITYLLTFGLLIGMYLFTTGCKTEPKVVDTPMSSANFKAMVVRHAVKDYNAFKAVYMGYDSMRMASGLQHYFLARGTEDTNVVVVVNKIADVQKAKDFAASPNLKMAMDSAGVSGPPTINFIDVIRDDTTTIPQNDRVMVSHRVKDFDAWLKVFDEEGRTVRASYGIVDRGMARDVDDPNMVYLVFAITDKAKAMERYQSEELKKIMLDAGVEGTPSSFFYTIDQSSR